MDDVNTGILFPDLKDARALFVALRRTRFIGPVPDADAESCHKIIPPLVMNFVMLAANKGVRLQLHQLDVEVSRKTVVGGLQAVYQMETLPPVDRGDYATIMLGLEMALSPPEARSEIGLNVLGTRIRQLSRLARVTAAFCLVQLDELSQEAFDKLVDTFDPSAGTVS